MRILFACIEYQSLTGMPMYLYELSREYVNRGHEVTIVAPTIGGEITNRTIKNGVNVKTFSSINIKDRFDIMHLNEYYPSGLALNIWPDIPAIATIHSEYECERPFVDNRIERYICIRPTIINHVKNSYNIPDNRLINIPNGIDFTRFKPQKIHNKKAKKTVLFVGTIDELRKQSILHLMANAITQDFRVIFVGKKHANYLDRELHKNVTWFESAWNIEDYLLLADETAGILLGRTTIESWAMGIPSWIYDIDLKGNIKSVKLYQPPEDIHKYNIINVTDRILNLYKEIIK